MNFTESFFTCVSLPPSWCELSAFLSRSTLWPLTAELSDDNRELSMSRILQIQSKFPLFVHFSCSEIKSMISKIMCIQSLIIAIKSKRCHLLKIKFIWSNTQHTIFNKCRPVNIFYFANNNWPIVRLKSFLWILWVSNLISDFVVWNLTVHDEVIICGFQTIKVSSKKPEIQLKICFIFQSSLYQYA